MMGGCAAGCGGNATIRGRRPRMVPEWSTLATQGPSWGRYWNRLGSIKSQGSNRRNPALIHGAGGIIGDVADPSSDAWYDGSVGEPIAVKYKNPWTIIQYPSVDWWIDWHTPVSCSEDIREFHRFWRGKCGPSPNHTSDGAATPTGNTGKSDRPGRRVRRTFCS